MPTPAQPLNGGGRGEGGGVVVVGGGAGHRFTPVQFQGQKKERKKEERNEL